MVAAPMEGMPRPDARSARGARTRDAFVRHLGTGQVARVIYGAIIGMALVVALQAHPPSATEMTVALLSTAVAVGLAEGYSDLVACKPHAVSLWDDLKKIRPNRQFDAASRSVRTREQNLNTVSRKFYVERSCARYRSQMRIHTIPLAKGVPLAVTAPPVIALVP